MLRLGGLSDFSELFRVKIRSRYYFNRELKNRYLIRINDGNTSSFPFILNGAILEANIFFFMGVTTTEGYGDCLSNCNRSEGGCG